MSENETRPSSPVVSADNLRTFKDRAAEALADEVRVLIDRHVIDSRSPAADALLDYVDGPSMRSPRADRLADLEAEVERLRNAKVVSAPEPGAEFVRAADALRDRYRSFVIAYVGDDASKYPSELLDYDHARASLSGSGKEKQDER